MTCNPAKNWVYTEYYRPAKDNKIKPYRKFIQSLVGDNTYISKHYEKQLFELDELSKQRLLYGNWEYDANEDNLTSVIVTPQQIYNEFSSGMQDVSAIRDFMKDLYVL